MGEFRTDEWTEKPKVKLNGVEVGEEPRNESDTNLLIVMLTAIASLMLFILAFVSPSGEAAGTSTDTNANTGTSSTASIDTPTPVTSSPFQGEVNGAYDPTPKLMYPTGNTFLVEDYQKGDEHSYVFYPATEDGGHTVKYGSDYELVVLKDGSGGDAYVDYLDHRLYVHESEIVTVRDGDYRRELVEQEEDGVKYLVAKRDGEYDFLSQAIEDGDYGVDKVTFNLRTVKEVVHLDDPESQAYVEGTLEIVYPTDDNYLVRPQAFFTPKTLYANDSVIRQTNQLHREYLDRTMTPPQIPDTPDMPTPDPTYDKSPTRSDEFETYEGYRKQMDYLDEVNA